MFPLFFHISLSFVVCFKNKYQSVLCVAHTCVPFSSANFNESHMNIVCVVYCYSITLYARATGWVLLRCAVDCFCCVHFSSVDRWSKGQKWNLLPIIYLLLRIRFGSNQYARVLNHSHTHTHTFQPYDRWAFFKCCLLMMMSFLYLIVWFSIIYWISFIDFSQLHGHIKWDSDIYGVENSLIRKYIYI